MSKKVDDVIPLTGSPIGTAAPKAAARLCNFASMSDVPLKSHQGWLGTTLIAAVRPLSHTWIEIIGFASKSGDPKYNLDLSKKRCLSVEKFIAFLTQQVDPTLAARISYVHSDPKGEDLSAGAEANNDGYWRAVEVYVFAAKPPPRPNPAPRPLAERNLKWSVKGYPGFMQSVGVGQFGIAFYKFRNDETMVERRFFSPQFGAGASVADMAGWIKFLKDRGKVGAQIADKVIEAILAKGSFANPRALFLKIAETLSSGASIPFEYTYTSCKVYRPLTFEILNLQTIGGVSTSYGVGSTGHTYVYGKVWYTEESGGKMFRTRDLLDFDSSGKGYQFPGLGTSGGPLIMF